LIIREPQNEDVHGALYDYDLKEHHMVLFDWSNETWQDQFSEYFNNWWYFTPESVILINGKGALPYGPNTSVPMETFYVKKGNRYRFRLINAGIRGCNMELTVESHNLTVIESDGRPFDPVVVETLVSDTGERYDFIINADQDEEKDYWIMIRAEDECFGDDHYMQRAILRYEKSNASYISNMTFHYNDSIKNGLVIF
jgi:FtsP/CotA-like multicopper oxidase with cupredoxin domain